MKKITITHEQIVNVLQFDAEFNEGLLEKADRIEPQPKDGKTFREHKVYLTKLIAIYREAIRLLKEHEKCRRRK